MPLCLHRSDFNFPYDPYEIQWQFMESLYNTLEEKKFGIFESPTGTGKSLSLICGSLTWLLEHNKRQKELLKSISEEEDTTEENSNDWFSAATRKIEIDKKKKDSFKKLQNIEKYEKKIKNIKDTINKKLTAPICSDIKNIHEEFDELFKDLNEVRENMKRELDLQKSGDDISMLESDFILDSDLCDEADNSLEPNENDEDDLLKIFYCSRTHSQLSQFIKEIQKTKLKSEVQVASLASRQNLCINDSVLKLSNLSLINERCLDLQKGSKATVKTEMDVIVKKKKTLTSCPFNKQSAIQHASYQILAEVQDLEQLVTTGKRTKGCPYYASRTSIKDSQLIVLPYQTLLHRGTREACNIKLQDNIVIVDEAHNLLETLANIHSSMLYYNQVCGAHSQLSQYLQRYEKRLSPQNFLYINQIMFFLKAYLKLLSNGPSWNGIDENMNSKSRLMTLQELLHETLTDNINIFKLVQYAEKSKIAQKLFGFSKMFHGQVKTSSTSENVSGLMTSNFLAKMNTSKSKNASGGISQIEDNSRESSKGLDSESDELSCGTPLLSVLEFMRSITCGSSDGRVLINYEKNVNKSYIKYLLLNPASQFHDIVKQCRSVIVAGGTMSPMDEFRDQLFISAGANKDRLVQFSCGHVVPDENILPIVFKEGPGGVKLDFTFKNRYNQRLLDDLGRLLVNICNVIPGGVVVFFPSYDYEEKVNQYFIKSGFIQKLGIKKMIFREPKKANQLDKVLTDYVNAVKEGIKSSKLNQRSILTGALIFSVVGGKMSEGINFSDDLGRCVVMVGMPYPNSTSPELKEKINYLNTHYPASESGKTAGACFYENLCFKAVNQSIGRSIRHRDDYSSILLLDQRYSLESSLSALPRWIGTQIKVCESFGPAFQLLRKFFSDKKR